MKRWVTISLVATAMACGGAAEETGEPEATPTAETGGESGALPTVPQPWEEMSPRDKGAFMSDHVLPVTRDLFQEYDAERYADFGCRTCHGENASERGFEMPNPDILALHPSGTPEQRQMVQENPEMVRFMFNQVLPTVRDMLQLPEYDPETEEGFSCFYCHTRAESSASDGGDAADETTEPAPEG